MLELWRMRALNRDGVLVSKVWGALDIFALTRKGREEGYCMLMEFGFGSVLGDLRDDVRLIGLR